MTKPIKIRTCNITVSLDVKAREWVAYHEVEWQNEVRQRALRAVSLLLLGLRSKKSAPSVIIRTELISQLA
jgi:hypothetical protein